MAESEFVVVLTTFPADGDADTFARTLVDERLAACVHLLPPMRSVYRWKDEVEQADERQVVVKTTAARVADLERRVAALHPYEVPELVVLSIATASAPYATWLRTSVERP